MAATATAAKARTEQEETRRAEQAAVLLLALLLRRTVQRAPSRGDLLVDADELQSRLTRIYLVGRATAGRYGVERFGAEADALAGVSVSLTPRPVLLEEARRANRAARGYVTGWLKRALGFVAADVDDPGAAAHVALAKRLRVGAEVEAAEAFNAARRTAIDDALRQEPGLVAVLEQVWNVDFCEGTCDDCAALDGMVIPLNETFPQGEPPLHPHCGCGIDIRPR